jgi:hypothetical protein
MVSICDRIKITECRLEGEGPCSALVIGVDGPPGLCSFLSSRSKAPNVPRGINSHHDAPATPAQPIKIARGAAEPVLGGTVTQ